jgi:hypothetical protein
MTFNPSNLLISSPRNIGIPSLSNGFTPLLASQSATLFLLWEHLEKFMDENLYLSSDSFFG